MLYAHRTFLPKTTATKYWPDALLLLLDTIHGGVVNLCYLVGRSAPVSIGLLVDNATWWCVNTQGGEKQKTYAKTLTLNSLRQTSKSFNSLVCRESSTSPSLQIV